MLSSQLMAERLLTVHLPGGSVDDVKDALGDFEPSSLWSLAHDGGSETSVLLDAEDTGDVLDRLESAFGGREGYRVIVLTVTASLPLPDEEDEEDEENQLFTRGRVSRAELFSALDGTISIGWLFVTMIILSSVVAAIGMARDNVAVIVGSMVIAPLLGPNMALSLATTLADTDLGRRAVKAGLTGTVVALAFACAVGALFPEALGADEITSRTAVNLSDVALALASGAAGALSFTTGVPSALIGVMVAVALLPPLVASGMLLGGGLLTAAGGAFLLFMCNVICVNLAGVGTFLVQGIRPATWLEAKNARRATAIAVITWIVLLGVLIAVIMLGTKEPLI